MNIFDKERCLCGIRVNPATEIIAIIHIAFYFLAAIRICVYLIESNGSGNSVYWIIIGFFILQILSSGFLLLGKIKSYTTCYLPFIILHVVFYIIAIVHFIHGLVIWIINEDSNHNNLLEEAIWPLLIYTILSIIYTYILSIVIRSRILKERANAPPAPENLIDA